MWEWLKDQVEQLWARLTQAINNAWRWATDKARDARDAAIAWARTAVDNAKILIQGWVETAKGLARALVDAAKIWAAARVEAAKIILRNLVAGVRQFATDLYNTVRTWVLDRVEDAKIWARGLYEAAKTLARALADEVRRWARGIVDAAKIWLQGIVKAVETVWNALLDQLKAWILEQLQAMGVDLPGFKEMLKMFLDSPVEFILAAVIPYFMAVLEWSLAYALGTKDRDLPPWPDFVGEGAGGGIYPGKGPPPGASGLAPPLDVLYISGYVFGPGHPGIDLGLTMGASVYAMHDGEVIFAGWDRRMYGYQVTIKGSHWWTLYGHLELPTVAPGQRVNAQQVIGLGDSTGYSSGPHLHLECKYDGDYIDPITVLPV